MDHTGQSNEDPPASVGTINFHCVIPDDEAGSARAFYQELFAAWSVRAQPPNQFWEVTGADGVTPQTAFLAIMTGPGTPKTPLQYYSVENIDAFIERAVDLGAPVVVPKTAVPGVGYFAQLADPVGNPFGLWESESPAAPVPGS